MNTSLIAQLAHLINIAYCFAIGEAAPSPWDQLSEGSRASQIAGVEFVIANPEAGPDAQHVSWMTAKQADGWVYGEAKDEDLKTHPALKPFSELPLETQVKDSLFSATVKALAVLPDPVALQARIDELTGQLKDAQAPGAPAKSSTKSAAKGEVGGVPEGFTPITYIGKRDIYYDHQYSQLHFVKGETQLVPSGKAAGMLKHADQYVLGDVAEVKPDDKQAAPLKPAQTDANTSKDAEAEANLQQAKDSISAMTDAESVRQYVETNFAGNKLHPRIGLEKAKAQAIQLLDQFGLG